MKMKAWWMALGLALLGSLRVAAQDSDSIGGITVQTLKLAEDVTPVLGARIIDAQNGDPLEGVQVWLEGTEKSDGAAVGGLTDVAGFIGLSEAPTGVWPLRVRLIGYQDEHFKLELSRSTATQVLVGLRRTQVQHFDRVYPVPVDSCESPELHAANGYLVDQFLRGGTNRREDGWGGGVEDRSRFLEEVTGALVDVWGPERVGVRLSPLNPFNDMEDSTPERTFPHAAGRLGDLGIAYLHVVEPDAEVVSGEREEHPVVTRMWEVFAGTIMLNGGYDLESGNRAVEEGRADLVSYAKLFLANSDLPRRFAEGLPLNEPDPDTFYGGDEEGYIDYPTWEEATEEGDAAPATADRSAGCSKPRSTS